MDNIEIKKLVIDDITIKYVEWLRDPKIIKYSNLQYLKTTLEKQIDYVNKMNTSSENILFGIFSDRHHIGNILLRSINFNHKTAEISYLIGNKKFLNQGIATYAVQLVCQYSTMKLNLKRLL